MASDPSAPTSTPDAGSGDGAGATGGTAQRSVAPFRAPKFSRGGLATFALWAGGGAFGLIAPTFLVTPDDDNASTGALLGAFGLTVIGVLIMVLACVIAFRRGRDGAIIIFAVIPTGVLLAGGMMLLGTKLFSF